MKKIIIFTAIISMLLGSVFSSKHYDTKIADLHTEIDEAYYYGYEDGVADGYNEGYEEGEDFGYHDGHSTGYYEGYEDGETNVLDTLAEARETYDDGYEDGFEIGYHNGYEDGFEEGKKTKANGSSKKVAETLEYNYVINKNTGKFHHTWCSSVNDMKASNRWNYSGTREEIIARGYVPCKRCNP